MKYKIIVDKQPKTNPSKDKRIYEIDIEELRYKGDIHDSLIITKNEDYVMRRLSLSEYQVLSVLDTPKKEPLKDVNIELFEGDNYIYLMDMTGNRLYIEYLVKNEFNDLYVLHSEMSSAITQTAKEIDLSVSRKLEGYSTKEATEASLKVMAEEIKSEVKEVKENAVAEVDVLYALGDTTTTAPITGWSTTAPAWQDGKYMWQKTVTTFADDTVKESQPTCISGAKGQKGDKGEQGLQGLQGEQGLQGIPGTNGMDGKDGESGKTTYFHIKYSSVANPATSSQMTETPNTYIGTYVDFTETDSTDPSKYTWSQFKGSQGEKGEKGIPGTNGTNGKTSYLHIAYATNSTGTTGFSVSDSTDKTYIGQYTDFTENDSTDPTKYSWSLIKGDKGDTGLQGPKGADGKQLFTWLKYADTPTSGMSDNPSGKNYIGLAYNKDTAIESTNYSDYTWSLIKGEKGDTGVAGPKGADGQQFYTWIKYADSPTTGMSDSPNNKNYIGLAYNKTTSAESSNYADYTWSLIKGDRGLGIKKLVEQYYLSTSNTTQTGGSWKTSQDKWTTGHYVWTRTKITWDDDTVTYTDPVLSNNLDEAFSQIEQNKTAIAQKVAKNDFGTLVEQNAEHVKIAWNKISEYLQMEVINGNVSLAIRNEAKKLLMALDKLGQHFYNGNYSMDTGAFDCYFPSYGQTYKSLMFALNEKSTNNFMAWGYKGTTESGEVVYTPVVFLGGQSDSDYGFHVNSDLFMGFNAIRFKNSKIFDNNDSLMFEVGEDIFIGDTRDGTEILSIYNNNGGTKTVDFHSCSVKADNLPTFDSSINHVTGSANHRIGLIFKDGSSVYIYADSSDKNLKKNIRNAKNNALEKILKINHKQFDWKSNNEHQEIGYIAQEMQKIDKTFVHYAEFETPDGEKKEDWQINTLSVLATATKAIQEQQEQIEKQQEQIDKNNKTIQDLLARVESLEKGANNG